MVTERKIITIRRRVFMSGKETKQDDVRHDVLKKKKAGFAFETAEACNKSHEVKDMKGFQGGGSKDLFKNFYHVFLPFAKIPIHLWCKYCFALYLTIGL